MSGGEADHRPAGGLSPVSGMYLPHRRTDEGYFGDRKTDCAPAKPTGERHANQSPAVGSPFIGGGNATSTNWRSTPTLRKLNLVARGDPVCDLVAGKIIEVGSLGAGNAVAIHKGPFGNFLRIEVPDASTWWSYFGKLGQAAFGSEAERFPDAWRQLRAW